jgi:hypothetical protein
MSCSNCADLDQVIDIQSPAALDMVARVVRGNLADGTITFTSDPVPVLQGESSGPPSDWPDWVRAEFACSHCGSPFILDVETYHGAGGRWRPG